MATPGIVHLDLRMEVVSLQRFVDDADLCCTFLGRQRFRNVANEKPKNSEVLEVSFVYDVEQHKFRFSAVFASIDGNVRQFHRVYGYLHPGMVEMLWRKSPIERLAVVKRRVYATATRQHRRRNFEHLFGAFQNAFDGLVSVGVSSYVVHV